MDATYFFIPHTYDRDSAAPGSQPYRCKCGHILVHPIHPHEPVKPYQGAGPNCRCGKPMDWVGHIR